MGNSTPEPDDFLNAIVSFSVQDLTLRHGETNNRAAQVQPLRARVAELEEALAEEQRRCSDLAAAEREAKEEAGRLRGDNKALNVRLQAAKTVKTYYAKASGEPKKVRRRKPTQKKPTATNRQEAKAP